jgi:CRP-like cAMP-binding protein
MELIDKIQLRPPLSTLPRAQLLRLFTGARLEQYAPGNELFARREAPKNLHVLLTGLVKLWTRQHGDAGTIHDVVKPGGIFLLPAVISGTPYVVGAAAIDKVEVLQLPAERVRKEVTTNTCLAAFFLKIVSQQYQHEQLRCIDIRTLTTTRRLGKLLLQLEQEQNNNRTVSLPYSKRLLAAQLQMTPESLSRALFKLKRYISWLDHSQIRIEDIDGLADYCDQCDTERIY